MHSIAKEGFHSFDCHTSTKALYLLSNFDIIWSASEWKGELSPTKMRVRHRSLFNPSVMSGLLQKGNQGYRFDICGQGERMVEMGKAFTY